jgi:hypothetical protein
MLERQDNQIPYRFIDIALFQVLCYHGDGTGAGAAGGTGDKQEGISFKEPFGGPDSIDDFIGVFFSYLGTKFVDFTDAMAAGFTTANEDSMAMVIANVG